MFFPPKITRSEKKIAMWKLCATRSLHCLFLVCLFIHFILSYNTEYTRTRKQQMTQWTILSCIYSMAFAAPLWHCSGFGQFFFSFVIGIVHSFHSFLRVLCLFVVLFSLCECACFGLNKSLRTHTAPFLEDTISNMFCSWCPAVSVFIDDLQNKLTENEHFVLVSTV